MGVQVVYTKETLFGSKTKKKHYLETNERVCAFDENPSI